MNERPVPDRFLDGDEQQSSDDPDSHGEPRAVEEPRAVGTTQSQDLAHTALARAKAAAKARGLRPGASGGSPGGPPARRGTGTDRGDIRHGVATHPTGRDPHPLSETLTGLVSDQGWQAQVSVGSVMGRWREIVGPDVADHCIPETFEDHRLVVRASSTAWATQVRLLAPTLLRRLDEEIGAGVVVQVKVLGPAGPGFGHGRRTVRGGRGPRDTWG